MRQIFIIFLLMIFIAGCASNQIKTGDIDKVTANCSNVDQQIAMLTKQKNGKASRVKAGVQSVVPVSAVINMVSGNYKENVQVASGERDKKIDAASRRINSINQEINRINVNDINPKIEINDTCETEIRFRKILN